MLLIGALRIVFKVGVLLFWQKNSDRAHSEAKKIRQNAPKLDFSWTSDWNVVMLQLNLRMFYLFLVHWSDVQLRQQLRAAQDEL